MKKYSLIVLCFSLALLIIAVLCGCGNQNEKSLWLNNESSGLPVSSASFTVQDGVIASASYKLRSQDGRLLEYRYTPQEGVILQGESSPTNLDRATKTTGADLDAALQAVIRKVRSEQPDAKELAVGFTAADFYFSGKDFFRGWVYSLSKNEFRSFASGGVYDGSREYGMLAVNADNQGTVLFCLDR